MAGHYQTHPGVQQASNLPSHPTGWGKQRSVVPGGSKCSSKSAPRQLPRERRTVGNRSPRPIIHPGMAAPGSKSRNPADSNQNSTAPNTSPTASDDRSTSMEKPSPSNQHQYSDGTTIKLTCAREPVTPKSGTDPTYPASGGTHNAGNEATTEPAPMPGLYTGPTTGTCNGSRRRSSALRAGVITGTALRPPFRTTTDAFPTALGPFATKQPWVNNHHAGPRTIGRKRGGAGSSIPTGTG